jgi:hypothetical protein
MRAMISRLVLSLAVGLIGTTSQAQEFIGGNFMLRAPMDEPYGLQMTPFAKALPDEQSLLDVVAYINTLSSSP